MRGLFFLFGVISSIYISAQTVEVIDEVTLQPIEKVAVFSKKPQASAVTNREGKASVSAFTKADSITFRCTGYQTANFSYKELKKQDFKIQLLERTYELNPYVLSANRTTEESKNVSQQVEIMNAKQLEFMNAQTSADVLQGSGKVLVQKSQQGGGSPIIRGFEANKVLIVVDGVRMNNAIFRGGHLQNVITMDNSILDKTEIIFGPGSVVYGSDALGGVMHFYTKSPLLADSGESMLTKVNAYTRFSTAASEKTGHIDFNIGGQKVAFLGSATVSDIGDLRQGGNRNPSYGDWGKRSFKVEQVNGSDTILPTNQPNLQDPSGYKQYDFLSKLLYQPSENTGHLLNVQYSTSSDIPRYDRLNQTDNNGLLRNAEWYYGPQKRLFTSYTLNLKADDNFYDNINVILAYQDIEESRHTRNLGSDQLNDRTENVKVYTLNTDLVKDINKHEIRYGLEATYNDITSTAFSKDIRTSEKSPLDTRYPDGGSDMQTQSAYFTHTLKLNPKWVLNDGIRYTRVQLNAKFNDTTFFPFLRNDVTQNSDALNGNLGIIYMPKAEWRFSLLGSSGFRAPNVDDLSKVFESVPGSVIVPNPDLRSEHTYNVEFSISKEFNKRIKVEGIGFYTLYDNVITNGEATVNGQDSILYDGVTSKVITSVNGREAFIYGFSGNLVAEVTNTFSISSTLNYTYGRIKSDTGKTPLDHIPPVFGKTSFRLNLQKFRSEFFVAYNGWKRKKDYNLVGEDNFAYATPEGNPAWYTLNVRTGYQFNENIQLQLALENILDQNYRVFASGIGAPGRNFIATVRAKF